MPRRLLLAALCSWGAAVLPAVPAAADWLVLRDGSRVETDGPWEVKGRLVVFRLAQGPLSSLRADAVDLEASGEATAAATEPPPPTPPPQQPRAVRRITDADIPRGTPPPPDAGAEGGEGAALSGEEGAAGEGREEAAASEGSGLVVESWEQVELPAGEGLRLYGTLVNNGTRPVTDASLEALVYDVAGTLVARAAGEVSQRALGAGGRTNFNVSLPGIFDVAALSFETRHRSFEPNREAPPANEDDELAAEEP
jgi:hypothetical protein